MGVVRTGFRRSAGSQVVLAVSGLLKSYQEEVDRLTQRARAGESAFLDVYQRLYEAPDPSPALALGLVRTRPLWQLHHQAASSQISLNTLDEPLGFRLPIFFFPHHPFPGWPRRGDSLSGRLPRACTRRPTPRPPSRSAWCGCSLIMNCTLAIPQGPCPRPRPYP